MRNFIQRSVPNSRALSLCPATEILTKPSWEKVGTRMVSMKSSSDALSRYWQISALRFNSAGVQVRFWSWRLAEVALVPRFRRGGLPAKSRDQGNRSEEQTC